MDRITRKGLKTDKFAAEVGQTVEFLEEHRKQSIIVGAALIVVLAIGAGSYYYFRHQHAVRQAALQQALLVFDGTVGKGANPFYPSFETDEERFKAIDAAFSDVAKRFAGSDEGVIATYYLALSANGQGRADKAEKLLRKARDSGREPYASQAAYTLAQLYAGLGRTEEAEKILRKLIDHPSIFVTKEQATLALAKVLASTKPDEARKLLEPLRTERSAISRAALTTLGELQKQRQ